jgi:malate dehydrogenase (oxaloacetate-decarboxylating)
MQGTGAVALAAILSAAAVVGRPLDEHRVVVYGSGTAGIGIADQLRDAMCSTGSSYDTATRQFWCVGRHGLLTDDRPDLRDFQAPYARPTSEVADWELDAELGGASLEEVVRRVRPTILIGTSGRPQAFTESIVRAMADHIDRPIIMPMSNPTHLAEAFPADLLAWTDGRALVATGSPFDPVVHAGTTHEIAQVNNALIFPGLGLGAIVARATRITDGMLFAAARAVADMAGGRGEGAALLPRVSDLRETSVLVAVAVARAAAEDGVAGTAVGDDIDDVVRASMWRCDYHPVVAV